MSQPIQTAVTISLVPQAKGGPFVFWDDLAQGMAQAAALGFDAVELFAPGPDAVPPEALRKQLTDVDSRHGCGNRKKRSAGVRSRFWIPTLQLTQPAMHVKHDDAFLIRS